MKNRNYFTEHDARKPYFVASGIWHRIFKTKAAASRYFNRIKEDPDMMALDPKSRTSIFVSPQEWKIIEEHRRISK